MRIDRPFIHSFIHRVFCSSSSRQTLQEKLQRRDLVQLEHVGDDEGFVDHLRRKPLGDARPVPGRQLDAFARSFPDQGSVARISDRILEKRHELGFVAAKDRLKFRLKIINVQVFSFHFHFCHKRT